MPGPANGSRLEHFGGSPAFETANAVAVQPYDLCTQRQSAETPVPLYIARVCGPRAGLDLVANMRRILALRESNLYLLFVLG